MELKDRKRQVDIEKLSPEQADIISEQIGARIREITDDAVEKANRILNVYSMKALMAIKIIGLNETKTENNLNKKKRKQKKA